MNSQLRGFFNAAVSVRQKIRQETLHDQHTSISIGGTPIHNLRFADNIGVMGGSNDGLQILTNRLTDRARFHGMDVNTKKRKIMTNSTNDIGADISMNGQILK